MRFWDFNRGPAGTRLLMDFGEQRGLSSAQLLAGTRLSSAQLDDPNFEVIATQELHVTDNLLRLLQYRPGLGFDVGKLYHFSAYGVWGYGLIASATARDALTLALRFLPLTYAFTSISYQEEGEYCVLTFEAPQFATPLSRFLVERDMTAAAILLKETAGKDFSLSRFALLAERPTTLNHTAHDPKAIAGIEPVFGARSNSLAFKRAWLDLRLPQANPLTASMCEQMCKRLIEARRTHVGTATMIRHYLDETSGTAMFSLEAMARRMNVSTRTLKRKLQEEGTTFRALVDESRSAIAETLLGDERMTLSNIADRLGFSDLSSFSQAFKRWYGVAPRVYRSRMTQSKQSD